MAVSALAFVLPWPRGVACRRPAGAWQPAYNGNMISREPTIERLATARQLLLEPFGLDETHLSRALAEIRAHQVDDADLYFQYTRAEGWSLEDRKSVV